MSNNSSKRPPAPVVGPGVRESEAARGRPANHADQSGQDALRAGNYAGFAARRVPPPEGAPADAPWRLMPPTYDGNSPAQPADADIAGVRQAAPAPRRPVFPPPSATELLIPVEPVGPVESVDIAFELMPVADPDPAVGSARRGRNSASNRYRGLTRLKDAVTPDDPTKPKGPKADRVAPLVAARLAQGEARWVLRRKPRSGVVEDGYVSTASTQAAQISRGRLLLRRYQREIGQQLKDEDVNPQDFVNWLFSFAPLVRDPSWRIYRAAGRALVQTLPQTGREEALEMLEVDVGAGADVIRSGQATRFAKADFDEVFKNIRMLTRSDAVPWIIDWLSAGINTGLSPLEWATADLEVLDDPSRPRGRRALLYVINAKASQAMGGIRIQRTLDISDFSDTAFKAVQDMVDRAEGWLLENEFEMRRSQCAQVLGEVCAVLFPRQRQRYSLYSLRHQFIANMRAIYQPAEVAALVGYIGMNNDKNNSENEAAESYAKRRVAWQLDEISERPVSVPEQVKNMRRRAELYEERLAAIRMRKAAKEKRSRLRAARVSSRAR
jgi:hypothetical protein